MLTNVKRKIIVLGGPTASGKTAISLAIAHQLKAEIISADSRQFYREIPIGTAQPSFEELNTVVHHFIADRKVSQPRSAADFESAALEKIEQLHHANRNVIVVGGSGLYLQALLYGFDEMPSIPEHVREYYNKLYQDDGLEALQKQVKKSDPQFFAQTDIHNPRRLLRALEVLHVSGRPYSSFRTGQPAHRPFETHCFALDWPREQLYERINKRVDEMMNRGLLEEAHNMLPFRNLQALQTVGYAELFKFFDGIWDLPTAVEEIKKNSRRYAKRQLTWLRAKPEFHWIPPQPEVILKKISSAYD
jgi:tRNA dimethylallyltransferase